MCPLTSNLSATGLTAPTTNGNFGTLNAGAVVTMTTTLGTATTGTFRIVGDPGGVVTLAGPATIPSTLTYVGTGTLPAGSVGVGYYIDTSNGTVNITASCAYSSEPVPTLSTYALFATMLLLATFAVWRLRRVR